MKLMTLDEFEVENIIAHSSPGRNTNFLKSSHNLWIRFKNYSKNPPCGLLKGGRVVSLIFATFNRNNYCNLYEIVTIQGEEGNGYGSQIWSAFVKYAVECRGVQRLKLSCTPSSVTWHIRNGLIFWGVDGTGSLRSDQPLFATREDQLKAQKFYVDSPESAIPPREVCLALKAETIEIHHFGPKKLEIVNKAISDVGPFWLRDFLEKKYE